MVTVWHIIWHSSWQSIIIYTFVQMMKWEFQSSQITMISRWTLQNVNSPPKICTLMMESPSNNHLIHTLVEKYWHVREQYTRQALVNKHTVSVQFYVQYEIATLSSLFNNTQNCTVSHDRAFAIQSFHHILKSQLCLYKVPFMQMTKVVNECWHSFLCFSYYYCQQLNLTIEDRTALYIHVRYSKDALLHFLLLS